MSGDQPARSVVRLQWGVKQSFRGYVEGAGGTIETEDGAHRTDDGGFVFDSAGEGLTLGADGSLQGVGRFVGLIRFKAHGGMLSVCLADPAVEITDSGAVLTVADTPARNYRAPIAQLDLAAMAVGEDGQITVPAALTIDGIQLLGDHYPPRTPLDLVYLTVA